MVPTSTGMFSIATASVVPRDNQEPVFDQGPGNDHGPGIDQIIAYVLLGSAVLYLIVAGILTYGACGYNFFRGLWRKKNRGTDVEEQRDMELGEMSSKPNDASSSSTGSIGPYSRNTVATPGFLGEPGVQSVSKSTTCDEVHAVSSDGPFHEVDLADPPQPPKTSGRPTCSIL